MQGEDGRIQAELNEKYAEIWAIYVDGWKGGASTPLDTTLFRQLMSSPTIANDALELSKYPLVKRQLEKCAARLTLSIESVHTEPGLVAVASKYAPQTLDLSVMVAAVSSMDSHADNASIAASYFAAALAKGRADIYKFMHRVFADVPHNATVHPRLLLAAAEAQLLFDPAWAVSLIRSTPPSLRESATAVILTAIRRGWDDDIAREVLLGYLDTLEDMTVGGEVTDSNSMVAHDDSQDTTVTAVPSASAQQPKVSGTILLGIAIGERHFTVSELRWMGEDNITELLRFEVWCSTLTVLNGGIPGDVPPIPADFAPALHTYDTLASVQVETLREQVRGRSVLLAMVPFAGALLSAERAQQKFNTIHGHTLEQFLDCE